MTGSASITLDYEGAIPQIDGYTEELVASNTWIFRNGKEYLSYAAGQATSRRAIVMPERGVFSCQNAVSEIYVEQNRSLFSYNHRGAVKADCKRDTTAYEAVSPWLLSFAGDNAVYYN